MYKTAVRRMIRRNVRALSRGDIGPLLAGYADRRTRGHAQGGGV